MTGRGSVLVTGAGGQLGRASASAFASRGWAVTAADHAALDVTDGAAVTAAVDGLGPDAVVHLAAWTDVDGCEGDPERAVAVNRRAVGHVAAACEASGAHLCVVSTDYVFDGASRRPYTETDRPNPLSVYGATKLAGEQEAGPAATVVRTSWLAGEGGPNVVRTVLDRAADPSVELAFVGDQRGSPTVAEDLAAVLERLVAERRAGLFHVTNAGDATWYELVRHVLAEAGHDPDRVRPITTADLDPPRAARRPSYSVLDNAALRWAGEPGLDPWPEAVARLVRRLLA